MVSVAEGKTKTKQKIRHRQRCKSHIRNRIVIPEAGKMMLQSINKYFTNTGQIRIATSSAR